MDNAPQALFIRRVLEGGYSLTRSEHWTTSATELAGVGEPLLLSTGGNGAQAVFEENHVLSTVGLFGGGVFASVAATSEGDLAERTRSLATRVLAPSRPPNDQRVPSGSRPPVSGVSAPSSAMPL